jgi:hypothetical protein
MENHSSDEAPTLPFKYKSKGRSEYGIYVELYLPKHAGFQGTLYETLTRGFDHEHVKNHFSDDKKRPKIIELLRHHKYEQWKNYTGEYVDRLKSLYWGYSLYEVDGVFKPKRGKKIVEERTQVIRFMFIPTELDKQLRKIKVRLGSEEHEDLLRDVKDLLRSARQAKGIIAESAGKKKKILQYLYEWYKAVGFFLFGYIVFEVCSRIEELGDSREAEYEKEVWLISFWHFNVNRFEFTGKR